MFIIICVTTALLFAQGFADITRLKRQDSTWTWPNETDVKENTKSTEKAQLFNQITTPKPNEEENPCDRPPPEKPNFKKPGRRVSEAKCMEYLWNTKARVEIEKNGADCLETSTELRGLAHSGSGQPVIGHPQRSPVQLDIGHLHISPILPVIGYPHRSPVQPAIDYPHRCPVQPIIRHPHRFPGAIGWRTVSDTWFFKCGSSLISEKYVLTAAHCSRSPPDTNLISNTPEIVRLGDKNIMDIPRFNAKIFDKEIKRIINHPKYASPKKYYDIALIELEEPVYFTKYMMPACLWTSSSTSNIGKATLTGWGVVDTVHRTTSPELQAAVVDVLESSVCDQLLMSHCNRHWCGMQEHQVCAGKLAGGVDACQGDSGGPLQVKIPLPASTNQSMHYVIGVTSFGIGCARQNLPGIYTRVSSFVDWIESVVWPDEL